MTLVIGGFQRIKILFFVGGLSRWRALEVDPTCPRNMGVDQQRRLYFHTVKDK